MSFSFSTTDGQSRYMWFDLLGENKQRSPFPPREFPKSPPKSPKPPTANNLTISCEVTWLILSLSQISIGGDVKESISQKEMKKSAASKHLIEGKHRRRKWKKFCVGNLNYDFPPLQLTQLVCSWFLSLDLLTHPISPPSSLPPKSQSAEMWKKSLNHVKLSPCWFADLITLILSCIWQ